MHTHRSESRRAGEEVPFAHVSEVGAVQGLCEARPLVIAQSRGRTFADYDRRAAVLPNKAEG